MSSPNAKAATSAKRRADTEQSRRAQKAAKTTSDSDSEPEQYVSVPSHVDVSSELGLTWIRTLKSVGKAYEINGDGNCGYSACQRGLEEYGDIDEGIAIGDFRHGLFEFATEEYEMFCGASPRYFADGGLYQFRNDGLGVMEPNGEAVKAYIIDRPPRKIKGRRELGNAPRARAQRFAERIRSVWEKDVVGNFSRGCLGPHYFDSTLSACILARKYKRSLVLYQKGANRSMTIAHYDVARDCVVSYLARGSWYTPPAGSVCIIHDGGVHYEYLRVSLFVYSFFAYDHKLCSHVIAHPASHPVRIFTFYYS